MPSSSSVFLLLSFPVFSLAFLAQDLLPALLCLFCLTRSPTLLFFNFPVHFCLLMQTSPFMVPLLCPYGALLGTVSFAAHVSVSPCVFELPCCHLSMLRFHSCPISYPALTSSLLGPLEASGKHLLGKPRGLLLNNKQKFIWVAFDGSCLEVHRIDRTSERDGKLGRGAAQDSLTTS